MQKMIDVVYAADHSYMLLCCVSAYSLMESLPSSVRVRLHLLIDESFSEEDEKLLSCLTDRFGNLLLIRHSIREEAFEKRDFEASLWSKAACYRLVLPGLLSDTDLCLYLDSDTLIVGDILPLWEENMEEYFLAGVFDDIAPVRHQTVGNRIPGIHTYINSGVLLMNLEKMRKKEIQEKLLNGVTDYLVVDQDLINVVCYGAIKLLPSDYNCIPGVYAAHPKILHFLMRDYLRPWKNRRAANAALWWNYAEKYGHLVDLDLLREQADWYQKGSISYIARRCADYARIYVCGSGPDAERIHRALRLGKIKGLQKVLSEEDMAQYSSDTLVINASRRREFPFVDSFLAHEGAGSQVICFSRRPISFYNLVPAECEREIESEFLMWEYGTDCRGVRSFTAMLEINAARYPDREALVEWRGGNRIAFTYRELNIRANRMADWIRQQGVRRGSRVRVPVGKVCAADRTAAVLGIIKGGCVVCLTDEAELTADLASLTDGQYSCQTPRIETLPDEAAFTADGELFTQGELCEMADQLRRRCGWHASDRLLAAEQLPGQGLVELIAAFYDGNTTIAVSDETGMELMEKIRVEKATIVSMDTLVFTETVRELEQNAADADMRHTGDCRMVLAGKILWEHGSFALQEPPAETVAGWNRLFRHIVVSGAGYEGTHYYNSRWYAY